MNWLNLFTDYWRELLVGFVIIITITIAFSFWLYWPRWQVDRLRATMPDTKARADVEDNFRKTAGQAIGGLAVLIGAGFAYLQFQGQQQASRDLLISNQVAKGFELLGNKDNQLQQRLGGIYALEGVMNTSKEYYRPVLEALSAFIRDRAAETNKGAKLGSDLRAALNVIGRRALLGEAVPDLPRIPHMWTAPSSQGFAAL
jgi:hypothetical protein